MSEQQQVCGIALENGTYEARPTKKFLRRKPFGKQDPGVIKALIPGVVAEIGTEVGKAVAGMDLLTQQNAELVARGATASASLQRQARQLVEAISVFR